MSIDGLPLDDPERREKARPWRQRVWDRLPDWAKIALWAILGLVMAEVLLGVRVWYGLQDPPEVAAIRGHGRHIIIPATNGDFRNPLTWLDAIPIGLRGTSADDVTAVRLDEQATDELVAYIAKYFPNVRSLYFSRGNITVRGLDPLKSCRNLGSLDVSDTDIDDGLGELLPYVPRLRELIVMNSNVGDSFAEAAARHDALEYCAVDGTNVTPAAVAAWKNDRPRTRIQTDFDRVALRAVIRWSDGETSRRFNGPYEMGQHGPQTANDSNVWSRSMTTKSSHLRADQLRWAPQFFAGEPDGSYQIRLKLGGIDAKPADFDLKDGKPTPDQLELRMPITRAEAQECAVINEVVK